MVVLDKNPFLGGNSVKATSGINAALTTTQVAHKIPDSVDAFYKATNGFDWCYLLTQLRTLLNQPDL